MVSYGLYNRPQLFDRETEHGLEHDQLGAGVRRTSTLSMRNRGLRSVEQHGNLTLR